MTKGLGENVARALEDIGFYARYQHHTDPAWVEIITGTGHWKLTVDGDWRGVFFEGPTGECTGDFTLTGTANEVDHVVIVRRIMTQLLEYVR